MPGKTISINIHNSPYHKSPSFYNQESFIIRKFFRNLSPQLKLFIVNVYTKVGKKRNTKNSSLKKYWPIGFSDEYIDSAWFWLINPSQKKIYQRHVETNFLSKNWHQILYYIYRENTFLFALLVYWGTYLKWT